MILTKDILANFKKCNTLIVRHNFDCQLEFLLNNDCRYIVPVESNLNLNDKAFVMVSINYNYCIQLLINFLKINDNLTVFFDSIGLQNDYLRKYKLHHDACYLKITRGDNLYMFLVDSSVTENNTARMIKEV